MSSKANIALVAIIATSLAWSGMSLPAFAQVDQENAKFAANVEFIRGHLEKAVENKEAGQNNLALAHAGHPVEEVYSLIAGPLSKTDNDLDSQLDSAMKALANNIHTMSVQQVKDAIDSINGLLDDAMLAVVGGESDDPAFGATVMVILLETSENEYEEGVVNGKIAQMIEYQDATAFQHRAEVIFDAVRAGMPEHEREEAAEFFDQLNSLTASNANPSEVETVIGGIVHELDEVFKLDLESSEQPDGWAYIDRIKGILDQSVEEYEAGNATEARTLARTAYLDNYEYIEGDIAEENKPLMEKIEQDMRVQLVQMIDDGRPVSEVKSHVEQIKTDLETARAIVTPEFPVAAIAAALAVGGTVAYARVRTSFGRWA